MKKLVCTLLALVMLLNLCACGSADKDDVSAQQPATSENTEEPKQKDEEKKSDTTQSFIDAINVETATEKGICGADLTWYYLDNVLVIKGTGAMTNYEVFINNAPWDEKDLEDDIHWVIIDEGITSIGDLAFCGEEYALLSKVVLPSTLETIGDSAFASCTSLASIEIPDGVTYIGDGAFWRTALTEVTIPGNVTYIGSGAFGETQITEITIPDNVKAFGPNVGAVESIVIPANITALFEFGNNISTITFEGNAPTMDLSTWSEGTAIAGLPAENSERPQSEITIYYSGSGFEPYIEACPGYNWVKK